MNDKTKFWTRLRKTWTMSHWQILAVVVLISAFYELLEFAAKPAYFKDPLHVLELLLHGIILPAALFTLHSTETQKNSAMTSLSLHDSFVDQLNKAGNWDQLIETIGQFPRNILPASGVCLIIKSPDSNNFGLELARVFDPGLQLLDFQNSLALNDTECCRAGSDHSLGLRPCHCMLLQLQEEENKALHQRYCLPLRDAETILGILHLYLPVSYRLSKDQKEFLRRIMPEIALSINEASLKRKSILREAAIETERLRLASDLHDTLGQDLAYLRNKIDQFIQNDMDQGNTLVRQDLDKMRLVAEEANQTVRNILAVTHSNQGSSLDDRLLAYATAIGERANLKISVNSAGQARILNPHMQFQIFLIFREVLANIEKHAHAHAVTVDLAWSDEELEMGIADDGRGFLKDHLEKNGHFGLTIIETRTQEMNGHLSIISAPNQGTKVAIRLPIHQNAALPQRVDNL